MRILPKRSVENNVYNTVIKPSEFGTSKVTEEAELEMLKDTPQILRYADIEFQGKFIVNDGMPVIVNDDEDAVEVKLELNNKEFLLDENLEISLSVDSSKIHSSEVDGVIFTNKQLVAQAKIILFETMIINRIKELLEIARSHVNSFVDTVEQTL